MSDLKEYKFVIEYGHRKNRIISNIYIESNSHEAARKKVEEITKNLKGKIKIKEIDAP